MSGEIVQFNEEAIKGAHGLTLNLTEGEAESHVKI
jgi:hypothetical protein